MDAEEYMQFMRYALVEESHNRTLRGENKNKLFSLFFSPAGKVGDYLRGRKKSGNVYVFFGGRVVVGPRWRELVGFLLFLVMVSAAVFIQVVLPLVEENSSNFQVCVLVPLLLVSLIFSFLFLFLASFTNPGIIPRNEEFDVSSKDASVRVDSTTGFLLPRYLLLNGVCVRQKFCRTCKVYRPPRSNHCSVCDNCVLKFDHHCPALGTCIGLGNYRWFILLTGSWCLASATSCWLTFLQGTRENAFSIAMFASNDWYSTAHLLLYPILLVVSFIGFIASLLLLLYHAYVSSHNLTTNEHLKKYYKVNPFDFGCWPNWVHCLCFPQKLFPKSDFFVQTMAASYRELASTNSECVSDFYDY